MTRERGSHYACLRTKDKPTPPAARRRAEIFGVPRPAFESSLAGEETLRASGTRDVDYPRRGSGGPSPVV